LALDGAREPLFGDDAPVAPQVSVFAVETPTIREFNRPQSPLVNVPIDDGIVSENPFLGEGSSLGSGLINVPVEGAIITETLVPPVVSATPAFGAR
jgi:hypothetical protein